ncbi:MAG: helix-turn-helix domain-containing protein [Bacteroidales bacterium]
MDYIFVMCLTLLSFFLLTLLRKKNRNLSDKILILWLFLLILTELAFLLQKNGYFGQVYIFFEIICTSHILHGVFLFFYYRSITNPKFRIRVYHLFHLIPFLALIATKILLSKVFMVFHCQEEGGCMCAENPYTNIIGLVKILVTGFYIALTYVSHIRLKRTKKYLLQNNVKILAWVNMVVYGVLTLFIIIATIQLLPVISIINFEDNTDINNIVISVFVILFMYVGQKNTFIKMNLFSENSDENEKEQPLDEKLLINFNQIEKFMVEKEPYLNPELSLSSFAEEIKLSRLDVSHAIKAGTGQSFPLYINSYRIKSIISKLNNPKYQKYTILAVAYESGFNSKASFNRIFKLHTGKTPSEFILSLQK